MRLIDADTLDKVKFHPLPYTHITPSDADAESYKRGWNDAIDAIMSEAPTIEWRKTVKWIERNPQNSDKCRLIECDQCGFAHIVGFNVPYEHWIENRNFCERCGADMRKKGEK